MNCTYEVIDKGYIGPFKQWYCASSYRKKGSFVLQFDRSLVNSQNSTQDSNDSRLKWTRLDWAGEPYLKTSPEKTLNVCVLALSKYPLCYLRLIPWLFSFLLTAKSELTNQGSSQGNSITEMSDSLLCCF